MRGRPRIKSRLKRDGDEVAHMGQAAAISAISEATCVFTYCVA
ncbi:MAG: hypothetical protein Q8O43_02525 [Dehalococcoidia bacterium]|nr:hypothetical protein [Dehalococcoidia bacterium]